ncbi:hypothetical protein Tco_1233502 [Tanacetum coccineum]
MDKKTTQNNPPAPKKPPMPPIFSFSTGEGYFTEQQEQQLRLDEEALRETLEEEAKAEKEWDERMKKEQAEYELFKLEIGVKSDSEYESD